MGIKVQTKSSNKSRGVQQSNCPCFVRSRSTGDTCYLRYDKDSFILHHLVSGTWWYIEDTLYNYELIPTYEDIIFRNT